MGAQGRTVRSVAPGSFLVLHKTRTGRRVPHSEAGLGAQGRTFRSVAPGSFLVLHKTRTKPARAVHELTVKPGRVLRVGPFWSVAPGSVLELRL